MFSSCRLFLSQKINGNEKWVEIQLLKAYANGVGDRGGPKTVGAMYEWIFAFGQEYHYSGVWRLGRNSVVNGVVDAYTIGTSSPQEEKSWRYSISNRRLEFVERYTMGGGREYGAKTLEVKIAVILENAQLDHRGVRPLGNATSGTGTVLMGSNILVPRLPITWEDMSG